MNRSLFSKQSLARWGSVAAVMLVGGSVAYYAIAEEAKKWEVHDMSRPRPPVITPGTYPTADAAGTAPSDALILFNGKDLSHFTAEDGKPAPWKLESGYMEAAGAGMMTKESFGDCQIHVEWASPEEVKGDSQGRGNSGVYIMGRYEVQILDSFKNDTYADGQASALYGQYPPLVNACLPPGKWQAYDIIFRRPHFAEDGKVLKPAIVTVFHNGVLTQDHSELKGTTAHHSPGVYAKHEDKLPIHLQFHGNPVRYRSIWVRQLEQ